MIGTATTFDDIAARIERHNRVRLEIAVDDATRLARKPRPEVGDETPEHRAKRRPDPLALLLARGSIDRDDLRAATEILDVLEALEKAIFRPVKLEPSAGGARYRQYHHLDGISPRMQMRYRERYMPWVQEMGATFFRGWRVSEIVFAVVRDGHSLREVRRSVRCRFGELSEVFRTALRRYAEIAEASEEEQRWLR